jgi:hypothetical protein
MRSEFRLLGEDLSWRITRIQGLDQLSANEQMSNEENESSPTLNKWAMLLLSAFLGEAYSIICHPVMKSPVASQWPNLYQE